MVCDRDCFNCIYDDCIQDQMTIEERHAVDERDRKITNKPPRKVGYYRQHAEERIAWQKNYYQENKEHICERSKIYREKNRDKINARRREWYRKRKEAQNAGT